MRKTLCRLIAAMQVAVMLIGLLTVSALAEHTPNIIAFSGAEKKSCTFAESGIYRIYAFGRGGDGGSSVEFSHDDDFYGPSGGGGGSGGVCGHEAAFAAGEVISLDFDGDTLTVSSSNILLICGSGEKGEDAYYDSDISYGAGIGGRAGTASGGNVLNKSVGGGSGITLPTTLENPGGSGGFVDTPYSDYGFGCGGKGGDGVLPDEGKNCGEKGGAAAVIIEYISVTEMRHIEMYRGGTPYQHAHEAVERDDAHNPVERPMMPHNTVIEVTAEPINVSDTATHSTARPNAAEQITDSGSDTPAANRPTTAEKPPATVFSASAANIPSLLFKALLRAILPPSSHSTQFTPISRRQTYPQAAQGAISSAQRFPSSIQQLRRRSSHRSAPPPLSDRRRLPTLRTRLLCRTLLRSAHRLLPPAPTPRVDRKNAAMICS